MGLGLREASGVRAHFAFTSQMTTFQTYGGRADLFSHSFDPNKENNGTL